jgi:putative tricarboxylic transport membrane protein
MKKYEILAAGFWIANSLLVVGLAYQLGVGTFRAPGPGLMPLLLGLLLLLISIYRSIRSMTDGHVGTAASKGSEATTNTAKLLVIGFVLFAYAFVLESLGFLIAAFLVLSFLFKAAGVKRWGYAIGYSALTIGVTYAGFTSLGVRFPPGILRFVGLG